jgi:hypothetical protein
MDFNLAAPTAAVTRLSSRARRGQAARSHPDQYKRARVRDFRFQGLHASELASQLVMVDLADLAQRWMAGEPAACDHHVLIRYMRDVQDTMDAGDGSATVVPRATLPGATTPPAARPQAATAVPAVASSSAPVRSCTRGS